MSFPFLEPLPVETLLAHGVPAPFVFGQADRVRFHELDVLDHVNNATYLTWFETFRVAYLKAYGISDYAQPGTRPGLVIRNIEIGYRAPLHLNDIYIVAGRSVSYRRTSWTMEYVVVAGGKVCAISRAVIVHMASDGVTKTPLPAAMIDAITTRDGATRDA